MDIRYLLLFVFLAASVLIVPVETNAADEQRQAYDKMVEEAVKEADDYVGQKQRQAAERHAQEQRAAVEEQEKEEARLRETEEKKKRSYGTHIISRPIEGEPPVVAVPLPSEAGTTGERGSSSAMPAIPPPAD